MNQWFVITLSLMALPGFFWLMITQVHGYVVESIPFKLKEGSTMADILPAPQFAKLGKKGKFDFNLTF